MLAIISNVWAVFWVVHLWLTGRESLSLLFVSISSSKQTEKCWQKLRVGCVWRIMRDDDQSAQHYHHHHHHQHTSCAHLPSSAQHILQFNWSGCVLCAVLCLYECAHMCVGSVVFMGSTSAVLWKDARMRRMWGGGGGGKGEEDERQNAWQRAFVCTLEQHQKHYHQRYW